MAGPDISIVLPAHNEAGNIAPMAAAIARRGRALRLL